MPARKISVVSIKELYYGDPIVAVAAPTTGLSGVEIFTHTWTKVDNIHQNTFKYEEQAASVTKYKNELTGKVYRSDTESEGDVQISFVIGEYDYTTKAALQGGVATDKKWGRGAAPATTYKAIKAITKDDVVIVFTNALLVATGSNTDKAVGLSLAATPEESGIAGLESEVWIDLTEVKAAV